MTTDREIADAAAVAVRSEGPDPALLTRIRDGLRDLPAPAAPVDEATDPGAVTAVPLPRRR